MRLAVELSGEHDTLARAEAHAILEAAGACLEGAGLARIVLAQAGDDGSVDPARIAERLALAWSVLAVHAECEPSVDAIVETADAIPLDGQTFAVRCSRLDSSLPAERVNTIETRLGQALSMRGTVDLDAPERTIRVLLTQDACVVGTETARVPRSTYEARHVEARPFFSPITLHPRLARALVNVARVQAGDTVWDPFVGTGGIALEAALVGAETIASDLDAAMVKGSQKTLAHFDAEARFLEGDVEDVGRRLLDEVGPLDAIVTDPPYGRASSTREEPIQALYARFFATAANLLQGGGQLVCVLPQEDAAALAPASLTVQEHHAWYVHGSLTRHIYRFQTEPENS